MRAATQTAATEPAADTSQAPITCGTGTDPSAIRVGIMIGEEKGSQDSTTASVPLEFIMTGLRKMIVKTSNMITGIAACCASCSLFTIDPAPAYNDTSKI